MKKLLLDLGGVFYSAAEPDDTFWERWAGRCDQAPESLAACFWHGPDIEAANVGRLVAERYYERASERLGVDSDTVRAMIEELFVGGFNDEFADFVRGLRSTGAAISVLTNNWSSEKEIMGRPEFRGLFDHVISSADVGTTKPGEAIYRIAHDRLGGEPGHLFFVDDSANNVQTALSLGWGATQFRTTVATIAGINAFFAR